MSASGFGTESSSPAGLVSRADAHELRGVDPGRGWLAGQGLEEDGAQAEDVGARVSEAARRLLGSQVAPLGLEQELPVSQPGSASSRSS